jgi:hypothetical protein
MDTLTKKPSFESASGKASSLAGEGGSVVTQGIAPGRATIGRFAISNGMSRLFACCHAERIADAANASRNAGGSE